MITIREGTVDTLKFTIKQIVDNKREVFDITGAAVTFEAKQVDPSPYQGDPNPPKTISKACAIINPLTGIVTCGLTAADTDTPGKYKCSLKIVKGGSTIYNKLPFDMVVWEL